MTTSLITQRVFFNALDISVVTSDYRSGIYSLSCASSDYIYIGSSTPMNNVWFDMSTASLVNSGTPRVEVFYGQAWVDVVDIIDQTNGMTQSNRVSWSLDLYKGWDYVQKSNTIPDLSGTNIYDKYWLRVSFPNSFTASVSYIGQKFSNDTYLQSIYPDLLQPTILTGYKSGKNDWNEQHFLAAEFIVKDLRKRNIIKDRGQIFDWTIFEEASAHKVAEIVYSAFGTAYKDHVLDAHKKYNSEMANRVLAIDENVDGRVDSIENKLTQGWMTR